MKRCTRRGYLGLAAAATTGLAGCSASTDGAGVSSDEVNAQAQQATATQTTTAGETATEANTDDGSDGSGEIEGDAESVYTRLYDETIDSVVSIRVPSAGGQRSGGQGSGFVYESNYVVTNAHVVGDADRIEVQFNRGESRTGEVVGRDERADLAVIEMSNSPDYAEALELVEEEPAVGTQVAAIGSPYGFEGSMTSGIVSAIDRSIPSPQGRGATIPNGIQTDAPVNPGNSGGPLVNLDGVVEGVINSGGGENIAFAISAPYAEKVISALIETGDYEHPYIGVRLLPTSRQLVRERNLQNSRGLLVEDVLSGTPAAGTLRNGDVLLAVDGEPVDSREALSSYLELETSPGDSVELTIRRNGERQGVDLTLGSRPDQ